MDSNICTSCESGRRLVNNKCYTNYTVKYTYKLSHAYKDFLQNTKSEPFRQAIAAKLNISKSRIVLSSISEGSTVIGGAIMTENEADANNISSTLSSGNLTDFTTMSKNISVVDYNPSNNGNSSSNCTYLNGCLSYRSQNKE